MRSDVVHSCLQNTLPSSAIIIYLVKMSSVTETGFLLSIYIQGVSKRALQLWKRIEIYTEDIHNVLNCQNVAKHTEFYLG